MTEALTLPEFALHLAMSDTGTFARHVMGFDYDQGEGGTALGSQRINEGTGGIRATGAHKQFTDFLDSPARLKHAQMPRETFKTCGVGALATRLCLGNFGFKALWGMQTKDFAIQKVEEVVKSHFDDSESRVRRLFGDVRGPVWTKDRLTFTNGSSITVTGVDSSKTGGHYHLILGDDLVDNNNASTAEGIAKVQSYFEMLFPMLLDGGVMVITGTRYHQADLYGHLIANMKSEFDILILDSGFTPVKTETGWDLEGEARFPHLSKKRLLSKLKTMQYEKFCSQYLNKIVSGMRQPFRRSQFQPIRKSEVDIANLTGFMFVDSATSLKESACHSAIVLIGIDPHDNAVILDVKLGHLDTWEVVGSVLAMATKWDREMTIQACSWEQIGLNTVFRAVIEKEQKLKGLRLTHVGVPRGVSEGSKLMRIKSLQHRFEEKRLFVCDTVPRHYQDLNESKLLWDPEGFREDDGALPVPGGELVDQFINFPVSKHFDLADAMADLDRAMPDGTRYCQHMPSASRRFHTRHKSAIRSGSRVNFPDERGDWYERTARKLGFAG